MREGKVAVITGTNSNLGLNIAYRILTESPPDTNLTIIVTSRTLPRVKEAITNIKEYAIEKLPGRTGYLEFDYLLVDFTDMVSTVSAYYELNKKYQHIDYLFVNAAQSVNAGIDWIEATKSVLTNVIESVTFPKFKLQRVGVKSDDGMGLVFQGNVFGPYYFVHKIKHLLLGGGKVIWVSSIVAEPKYLSFEDLQLLKTPEPYEGSKRLIDLVHVGNYEKWNKEGISSYVVHPGIFNSFSYFQYLNFFTFYGMVMLFYIARFMGSTIHNISGYTAANSPVSAALTQPDQSQKLAACCNKWGKEFLESIEIDPTGAEDVEQYLSGLAKEWDEKLKDQIVKTRMP